MSYDGRHHTVQIGNVTRDLPLFQVAPGVKMAIFNRLGDSAVVEPAARLLAQRAPRDADVILVDNRAPELLEKAVKINEAQGDRKVVLEASGGISLKTIRAVAETGVDFISTSKITMAAPTLDVGLDVEVK